MYIIVMAIQLNLFGDDSPEKKEQRKDKNRNAQWDKFYTLYMFDEIKYHRLVKEYIKANNFVTYQDIPKDELKRIKSECYVRDENGELQPMGDAKHIYRYKTLYKILEQVANFVSVPFNIKDGNYNIDGLIYSVYKQDRERYYYKGQYFWSTPVLYRDAFILGTESMQIKDRVLIHIHLLRLLKKGISVKKAVERTKELFKM